MAPTTYYMSSTFFPWNKHSFVLNVTVSADFKVTQLMHPCARKRQITYVAGFEFHKDTPLLRLW